MIVRCSSCSQYGRIADQPAEVVALGLVQDRAGLVDHARREAPRATIRSSAARSPSCIRLLTHCARRAASRAAWTAGSSRRDQDGDDRDHHQQLDQREAPPTRPAAGRGNLGSWRHLRNRGSSGTTDRSRPRVALGKRIQQVRTPETSRGSRMTTDQMQSSMTCLDSPVTILFVLSILCLSVKSVIRVELFRPANLSRPICPPDGRLSFNPWWASSTDGSSGLAGAVRGDSRPGRGSSGVSRRRAGRSTVIVTVAASAESSSRASMSQVSPV